MNNLPLEYYEQFPFARKAVIFLQTADKLNEIENRTVGSWEVSYYLLSHAIELAIKAIACYKTGKLPPKLHDKVVLSIKYKRECDFSSDELDAIQQIKKLNNGPGGLRYENTPNGQFLPSTFDSGKKVVKRLLSLLK